MKTTQCNLNNEILLSVKGTTWIQEVVDSILNEGDVEKCKRAPTQMRMPFLEMTASDGSSSGITKLEVMDPPRVIKTHLPVQLVPRSFWDAGCKVRFNRLY